MAGGLAQLLVVEDPHEVAKQLGVELRVLLGQHATEEVAHLVAFLASDKAKYITGQVIAIDGDIDTVAADITKVKAAAA